MLPDMELMFCNDQAIHATGASEKVVNKGAAGGPMRSAWLIVNVPEAYNTTLSAMNIALQTSDDDFATDTEELLSKDFVLADLTLNANLMKIQLPLGIKEDLRLYITITGTPTTGKLWANIVPNVRAV